MFVDDCDIIIYKLQRGVGLFKTAANEELSGTPMQEYKKDVNYEYTIAGAHRIPTNVPRSRHINYQKII
jgi:hypothetical protein